MKPDSIFIGKLIRRLDIKDEKLKDELQTYIDNISNENFALKTKLNKIKTIVDFKE